METGAIMANFTIRRAGEAQPTDNPFIIRKAAPVAPEVVPQPQEPGLLEFIQGTPEVAAMIASGAIAEPIAGLAGILGTILPGPEGQGAKLVEETREALTFQPETQAGKATAQALGETLQPIIEPVARGVQAVSDVAFEAGGPLAGTVLKTAIASIPEILGLRGLKSLRRGTILLDDAGRPTKALRQAFDKQGIDFDNLTPEIQAAIPQRVEPALLPGANVAAQEAEKVLVKQITSGARDDALAGLRVSKGKIAADSVANEAIKQGFEPGFVQSVKTATAATKTSMLKMTRMMKQIKKQARLSVEIRPSNVVGDAVTERIKFIRDKADVANKELNQIASKKLPGKEIDTQPVMDVLAESLDDLDVELVQKLGELPKPKFEGSLISKDKSSQRVIRDLVDILTEPKAPDALRAHKVKRQIDIMIDFNKKSAQGLSNAGKNVLKKVRAQLNDSVRAVDPDYARVNDVLSESLDTLGGLDEAVGSIDIFGKGANKALGTRMRALLSNQQGRVRIENALDQINETASNLGAKFTDDIKDLILFSDGLNSKFGTVAKTSLAGQTEQAVKQALTATPQATIVGKGAEVIGRGVEKLRGINDFNSFEALEKLLRQGGN